MTGNEDFAIKNDLQGTSMENCKQPLFDMANKQKTIYLGDQFILVNEKEMGEHLGAFLKQTSFPLEISRGKCRRIHRVELFKEPVKNLLDFLVLRKQGSDFLTNKK